MATVLKTLKYDASTAARFGQWSGGIENAIISTMGWARTTDTGQSGCQVGAVTFVARVSLVATVTFTAGPVYYVGQSVTIAGCSNTAFNGTFTVTGVTSTTITFAIAAGTLSTTADSGSINVSLPSTSAFVYQIFKMADTLQSTAPVFIKLEFGHSSSGNVPWIAFTIGTGSDGAGAITGTTSTRIVHNGSTAGAGADTTYNCYFSGDTNRMTMVLWQALNATASTIPFGIQIERAHDTTGADVSTYFGYLIFFNGGGFFQHIFGIAGSITTGETTVPGSYPGMTAFNNTIFFEPWFPVIGQKGNPMIGGAGKGSDTTNTNTVTVNFYGTSHTLIAFTVQPFAGVLSAGSSSCFFRYE